MPDPRPGEPRDDFISRCIPIVLDDSTAEDNDQAVAICNSMWEDADKRSGKMEHKTFSGFVTKADEEQGIIETAFAVMGNIDEGEDIIHPGAFIKTFAERGHQVLVLDSHRTDSIMRAIGTPLMFKEMSREEMPAEMLEKYPGVTGGAFARVQMLMDTPEGKGAFIRLRAKAVHKWSFGYDALDVDFSQAVEDGKEVNVRNLRTIKLYEISPVLFGMNEATTTLSAKTDAVDQFISDVAAVVVAQAEDEALMDKSGEAEKIPDAFLAALLHFRKALDDFEITVTKVTEQEQTETAPVEQAAITQHDQAQAGPQDAPTSKELLELELLAIQIETLEANHEQELRPA